MASNKATLPLVYSCSGCSSAAQLANHVALALDRRGAAEMSCIAGVGGDVAALVKLACSGRPIIAIDGCALACVQHCLARHALVAERHVLLAKYGVRKRLHADFDVAEAERIVAALLADGLGAESAPDQVGESLEKLKLSIGINTEAGPAIVGAPPGAPPDIIKQLHSTPDPRSLDLADPSRSSPCSTI